MVYQVSGRILNGWLVSPDGSLCYQFYLNPKSLLEGFPFVFINEWTMRPDGIPFQLKRRSKLPLDDALELCCQMLLEGWSKLVTRFRSYA
ncbi:DUF1651 domain-containing protein [Prochlorococcus sp. MIT 1300]|uniref:DUF1651 domain-containing protein n=1 Tax=Prochlorococcus sp. MIT 1300 TaxID=3096218 RepID=UPI002A751D7D|nr:DUF1651 domain-containing protein [Prochlorococcus sp. MIT 1300]